MDMLGRPVLSESHEDGTNYTISARTHTLIWDRSHLPRVRCAPRPNLADNWTRITKDDAGRVLKSLRLVAPRSRFGLERPVLYRRVTTAYEAISPP